MIKKWETIETENCGNYRVFELYKKKRIHPITKSISTFTSLHATSWVNIIPITTNGEVVLVEQYRHGTDDISIELPAGLVEIDEDTRIAAERECTEETGYVGDGQAILLGAVRPNPAFLDNYCYHYLWTGCQLRHSQNLDENEDINVLTIPFADIHKWIEEGKIQHSLVMSALYFYAIHENK
ncbi:MAG: NUDIX hydrolase [Ignavibacteria bacterium]|jgi:8-oxo-dGTP pyrophosphatase MutT (NUDIX family)|nr:NUDIX hydrolase [Ignavibacteria bacterium]